MLGATIEVAPISMSAIQHGGITQVFFPARLKSLVMIPSALIYSE